METLIDLMNLANSAKKTILHPPKILWTSNDFKSLLIDGVEVSLGKLKTTVHTLIREAEELLEDLTLGLKINLNALFIETLQRENFSNQNENFSPIPDYSAKVVERIAELKFVGLNFV